MLASSDGRLISEPVIPLSSSFNAEAMASGMPGVPMSFVWRNTPYRVNTILSIEKSLRNCHSGSAEKYVDKHFFRIITDTGEIMTLYRTRGATKKDQWILYTIDTTNHKKSGVNPMRIAVLVSGGGTNLQALLDAQSVDQIADQTTTKNTKGRFEIVLVIADRADTFAIERAKKAGIRAELAIPPKGIPRVEARKFVSDRVLALTREYRVDAIVLAGFLTIMSGDVISEYSGKIINLHPALLPKFGGQGMWGHHVHEAVLASGDGESGCTVHLVDSGCDTGEILLQRKVSILPGDTADTLAVRIHAEEHRAIVEGTRLLAEKLAT